MPSSSRSPRSRSRTIAGAASGAPLALEEPPSAAACASPSPSRRASGGCASAFRGTLNDKLRGFYRVSYKDPAGVTRTLAATQFEATDARRAFPCWDEPAFKAVFARRS